MREILFRGKHIHALPQNKHLDGTWVYGYLCDENYINTVDEDEYGGKFTSEMLIDSETVCQYTGLTDKNGRKIFEGDIISKRVNIYSLGGMKPTGERVLVGTVIWDESSAIYPGGWSIRAKDEHGNDTVYAFDKGFEVIGNIFGNPELMK